MLSASVGIAGTTLTNNSSTTATSTGKCGATLKNQVLEASSTPFQSDPQKSAFIEPSPTGMTIYLQKTKYMRF